MQQDLQNHAVQSPRTPKGRHQFDYHGFRVQVELSGVSDTHVVSAHALITGEAVQSFRVCLSTSQHDGCSALATVADRARRLIDERSAIGNADLRAGSDTDFADPSWALSPHPPNRHASDHE